MRVRLLRAIWRARPPTARSARRPVRLLRYEMPTATPKTVKRPHATVPNAMDAVNCRNVRASIDAGIGPCPFERPLSTERHLRHDSFMVRASGMHWLVQDAQEAAPN